MERISTVNEQLFSTPSTAQELFDMCDAASEAIWAAKEHIEDVDPEAGRILSDAYGHVTDAYGWILRGITYLTPLTNVRE